MASLFSKIVNRLFKSSQTSEDQEIEQPVQIAEPIIEEPKQIEEPVIEQPLIIETPKEVIEKPKKLSKEKFDKIQILHNIITNRFKFVIQQNRKRVFPIDSVENIENDIHKLNSIENKITLSSEDNRMLDELFAKYSL